MSFRTVLKDSSDSVSPRSSRTRVGSGVGFRLGPAAGADFPDDPPLWGSLALGGVMNGRGFAFLCSGGLSRVLRLFLG